MNRSYDKYKRQLPSTINEEKTAWKLENLERLVYAPFDFNYRDIIGTPAYRVSMSLFGSDIFLLNRRSRCAAAYISNVRSRFFSQKDFLIEIGGEIYIGGSECKRHGDKRRIASCVPRTTLKARIN